MLRIRHLYLSWGLVCALSLLMSGSGCAERERVERLPAEVSIQLNKPGIVADFKFKVRKERSYNYYVRFKFPENDQAERARVKRIVGGNERDYAGVPLDPGIPTPFKLTIKKLEKQGQLVVYQKTITPLLTSWGGDFFGKLLGYCYLYPGTYHAKLELLTSAPEYASIPKVLIVNWHSKI
jgi:hypothetical protein